MSDQVSITSWSMVATVGWLTALLISGVSFVAAEPPASSPTVQNEKATPADSGDVQERGIRRGQFGGPLAPSTNPPVVNPRVSGFYCVQSKQTCYCDRTQSGDCDLMKGYVCLPGTYKDTTVLDGECTAKR